VMKHGPFSSAPEVSHESTRGVSRTRALARLGINHLLMTWGSYRSQAGKLGTLSTFMYTTFNNSKIERKNENFTTLTAL
jgi:hypothetical protein